ncbi:molybdenum cofactor biosynthesis protein [Thiomicrorhabdus immobilis]|uniref:Molybdenum cofactor biosynthesis protein n=1 Tax=Thiomicrorhabdus immobilis TaxID=2791037 RepID=A0ABN6CWN7_9GAMM|nr:MOSC domain-containing protein [Thiomicrorhabdus immobilis]BCN93456.1 molybdenum cofactor biosynthesis protein [Thiomicrorhabdus immobilis]
MAKLIGIATHQDSRGEIHTHNEIQISLETGLEKDYQGKKNPNTSVTLLSKKSWELACAQAGKELNWTERRANLLIDDIEFSDLMVGQQIQIGNVLLEITKETDPCSRMDELQPGLKEALSPDWRGGARCKVLRKGEVTIGDKVTILKRF